MPSGIIIIDKPQDWTSMDVCGKLRRLMGERRVGHAGTLDPMATGVLPVFVGRATRAVEFAEQGEKEYLAGLKLGLVTDTQDTTGEALETHPVTCTREAIEAALAGFRGEIDQMMTALAMSDTSAPQPMTPPNSMSAPASKSRMSPSSRAR